MKKCIVCKVKEATVPDRDDWPRYRVRLCADCHAGRLGADLRSVIRAQPRKTKDYS